MAEPVDKDAAIYSQVLGLLPDGSVCAGDLTPYVRPSTTRCDDQGPKILFPFFVVLWALLKGIPGEDPKEELIIFYGQEGHEHKQIIKGTN